MIGFGSAIIQRSGASAERRIMAGLLRMALPLTSLKYAHGLIENLRLGAWSFSGCWSLEFGFFVSA